MVAPSLLARARARTSWVRANPGSWVENNLPPLVFNLVHSFRPYEPTPEQSDLNRLGRLGNPAISTRIVKGNKVSVGTQTEQALKRTLGTQTEIGVIQTLEQKNQLLERRLNHLREVLLDTTKRDQLLRALDIIGASPEGSQTVHKEVKRLKTKQ